jgi:hypothetical protein
MFDIWEGFSFVVRRGSDGCVAYVIVGIELLCCLDMGVVLVGLYFYT